MLRTLENNSLMKQVVQDLQKKEIRILDVPVPKPNAGMALVKTRASLVSTGTERKLVNFAEQNLLNKARARPDLVRQTLDKAKRDGLASTIEAVRNRLDQSIPLGYSSAGIIVELGDGCNFSVGDRVACAGGGYAVHAEYAVVPEHLMARLSENVSFEEGAFATLGAIALHGYRLAELQLGERVAVIGLGLVGLLAAQIAEAGGCQVLGIDSDEDRVALARRLGIDAVIREGAEAIANTSEHNRYDAVIICADTSSNDPVTLAGELARDRGKIVAVGAVGMQIPRKLYFEKELSFKVSRSYGPGRYDPTYEEKGVDYPIGYVRWTEGRNLSTFLDLVDAGKIKIEPLISHRYDIARAAEAYETIAGEGTAPFVGVVIQYPADGEYAPEQRKVILARDRMASTDRIRLGVLGAGNFARAVMFPVLKRLKSIELVGLAASSGLSARAASDRYGFQFATTDENLIIDDTSINTLLLLTRHHLHARQVIAGLNAEKNVFCEKPLAMNQQQVEEIIEALNASDKLLMVGFNRRFAPLAVKLKHFLQDIHSPLMMHYRVNAGNLPDSHWTLDAEQGGGRIIGEGCHFIDFMIFLTGSLPIRVRTEGIGGDHASSEENVTITLQFADGSLGTIVYTSEGDRAFSKERLEVFAGGRVAVLDDFKSLEMVSQGKRKIKRTRGAQDKGHFAEWKAFVAAIMQGGPPPIPYDHLLAATSASFAALESLHSRQTVDLKTSTQS